MNSLAPRLSLSSCCSSQTFSPFELQTQFSPKSSPYAHLVKPIVSFKDITKSPKEDRNKHIVITISQLAYHRLFITELFYHISNHKLLYPPHYTPFNMLKYLHARFTYTYINESFEREYRE